MLMASCVSKPLPPNPFCHRHQVFSVGKSFIQTFSKRPWTPSMMQKPPKPITAHKVFLPPPQFRSPSPRTTVDLLKPPSALPTGRGGRGAGVPAPPGHRGVARRLLRREAQRVRQGDGRVHRRGHCPAAGRGAAAAARQRVAVPAARLVLFVGFGGTLVLCTSVMCFVCVFVWVGGQVRVFFCGQVCM